MEKLTALYKENLTCSDSSIKVYVANITKLAKDMGKPLDLDTFNDFEAVKAFIINNNTALTTRKNKASSVNIYLKANGVKDDRYVKWIEKIAGNINDLLGENEKSPKEEANWITKDELETLRKNMWLGLKAVADRNTPSYNTLKMFQQYFMLTFHMFYPLRNDLATATIGNQPFTKLTSNYIRVRPYLKTASMYLVDYKTSGTYGTQEFPITEPLVLEALTSYYDVLKKYTGNKGKQDLIIGKDYKSISRNSYTKYFEDIFKSTGKNISTTIMRKIVVSNVYDTKKIKELARIMGHSVEQQMNVYAKDL